MDLAFVLENNRDILEYLYVFIVEDSRDILALSSVSIDIFIVFQPTVRGLTADFQSFLSYRAELILEYLDTVAPNVGIPWEDYGSDSD